MSWLAARPFGRAPVAALVAVLALLPAACAERPARLGPETPVVLIVVDTLGAGRVGHWGHERDTTPALDRRLAQAVVFERAWTTSSWTLPSIASLATGLVPARHGTSWRLGKRSFTTLPEELPTLALRMRESGRRTAAFVANIYGTRRFGLERGFDDFHDLAGDESTPPEVAGVVVEQASAWLRQHAGGPFFLYLHVLDPHMPYDAPEPARGLFTAGLDSHLSLPLDASRQQVIRVLSKQPDSRAFIAAAHDEEIRYVDQQLERLFVTLEQLGLQERALVALTSDHGEELFEHGGFEHGHSLYEELLHVPLAFWGPGLNSRQVAQPVSLVDVGATLLEAVGAPPLGAVDGVSLWPVLTGAQAPPERQLVAQWLFHGSSQEAALAYPWKLVVLGDSGRRRLYQLERDPAERIDLADAHPDLVEVLAAHLAGLAGGPVEQGPATEIDDEAAERLRALGYLN